MIESEKKREDFYNSDRFERVVYESGQDLCPVPVTKDGFEAMVEQAAMLKNLPVDDGLRSVAAGYIHHIENNVVEISLNELSKILYKVVSNNMTYAIDQEVKKKLQEEKQKAAQDLVDKAKSELPLSVVPQSTVDA